PGKLASRSVRSRCICKSSLSPDAALRGIETLSVSRSSVFAKPGSTLRIARKARIIRPEPINKTSARPTWSMARECRARLRSRPARAGGGGGGARGAFWLKGGTPAGRRPRRDRDSEGEKQSGRIDRNLFEARQPRRAQPEDDFHDGDRESGAESPADQRQGEA